MMSIDALLGMMFLLLLKSLKCTLVQRGVFSSYELCSTNS